VHATASVAGTWATWQLLGRYLNLQRAAPRAQPPVSTKSTTPGDGDGSSGFSFTAPGAASTTRE